MGRLSGRAAQRGGEGYGNQPQGGVTVAEVSRASVLICRFDLARQASKSPALQ